MEYFLIKPDGETTGTFNIDQIRAMMNSGFIGPDTRYWHEGITGWIPIDRIEESLQFEPPAPTATKSIPAHKIAAVLKAVPPPSTKLESKGPDLVAKKAADRLPYVPPVVPREHTPREHPPTEEREDPWPAPAQAAPTIIKEYRDKPPSLLSRLLYILVGALIVLALDHGADAIHSVSDSLASKLTLTGDGAFALLYPAKIQSFEHDLHTAPMVDILKNQISQVTDAGLKQRLTIGVETERVRHISEVRQQYVRDNNAEFIDANTYRIISFYDLNGNDTTEQKGQPVWVAIKFRDRVVYVFKGSDAYHPSQ
jgi:hypothetical protein